MGLCLAVLAATSSRLTQQVQLLLEGLKRSLTQPFQQLPAVIATFAAEAVFVLMAPGSAMYTPVNKLLLKCPALNIEVGLRNLSQCLCAFLAHAPALASTPALAFALVLYINHCFILAQICHTGYLALATQGILFFSHAGILLLPHRVSCSCSWCMSESLSQIGTEA